MAGRQRQLPGRPGGRGGGPRGFSLHHSSVRANRAFLARAVEYLAAEEGIRQFLDIGTGLPSANNTHEVAQMTAAESHVVYVDNDPVVMLHAQALLTSTAPGVTDYIEADLRDPATILAEASAHAGLHPAGRHHAHRDSAFHFRRRPSLRNSLIP